MMMIGPVETEVEPQLLIKPGHSVAVINAVSAESVLIPMAGALDPDQADVVIGFIARRQDLDRIVALYTAAWTNRLAWVGYPKPGRLGTDLDRDWLAGAVRRHDVEAIRDVSIDDTWSALRLVARQQSTNSPSLNPHRPRLTGFCDIADESPSTVHCPSHAGLTDSGYRRSSNEDRWLADPAQCLYVVVDGIGTAAHSGLAAQLVTELLPAYLPCHLAAGDLRGLDAAPQLGNAVARLSDDLHARARTEPGLADAHTTVVAALITASHALITHLGDSRAYLYRHHRVHRLTRDHSLIQILIDTGAITHDAAVHHPMRSTLTRYVAMTPPASPEVCGLDLQPADRMLLCTDGLYDAVDDASLAAILAAHRDPAKACAALIQAANQAEGRNDITAVVIDV